MKIDKKSIRRILLITLTNIGDVILTMPVITALEKEFPEARLDVMAGPGGRDIFINDPRIFKVIAYYKHHTLSEKRRLIKRLRAVRYDLVIDLKNTLFPLLIGARYRTSPIRPQPDISMHKKDFHLSKLNQFGLDVSNAIFSIHVTDHDRDYVGALLANVPNKERLVLVSPSAKSLIKRWGKEGFAKVADRLAKELEASIVMVGDASDKEFIDGVIGAMETRPRPFNFAGLTTIPQLAELFRRSRLVLTNDSAPMHVASAVGANVVAIFGPTDHSKYGPLGDGARVVRRELACSPCEVAECRYKHECMKQISADEVYATAREAMGFTPLNPKSRVSGQ